jgi:hypothetical protein
MAMACLAFSAGCSSESLLRSGVSFIEGPTPLPKAKFVVRANRLCTQALLVAERNALRVVEDKARLYVRHGNLRQAKGFLRRQEIATMLAPALHTRVERVRLLGIPERDRHRVGRILRTVEAKAWEAEANAFYFLADGNPMEGVRSRAHEYGIEPCAILYDRAEGIYQAGSARPGVRLTPRSSK